MAKRPQHLKDNDAIVAKTIGKRLNILRTGARLTLEDLAGVVSVSHQELSSYERGTRKPSLSVLIALATYFNTTVDYLLGLEGLETGLSDDDPRKVMKDFVRPI